MCVHQHNVINYDFYLKPIKIINVNGFIDVHYFYKLQSLEPPIFRRIINIILPYHYIAVNSLYGFNLFVIRKYLFTHPAGH